MQGIKQSVYITLFDHEATHNNYIDLGHCGLLKSALHCS